MMTKSTAAEKHSYYDKNHAGCLIETTMIILRSEEQGKQQQQQQNTIIFGPYTFKVHQGDEQQLFFGYLSLFCIKLDQVSAGQPKVSYVLL